MRTPAHGVSVTDAALARIVVRAAESVDGVKVRRPRRHLQIDVAAGDARVSIDLTVGYGRVLLDAASDVQRRVADALGTMCGVNVRSVDVNVEGVA